jgi:hypothetical protein
MSRYARSWRSYQPEPVWGTVLGLAVVVLALVLQW